jgi:predicted dehydrogenase
MVSTLRAGVIGLGILGSQYARLLHERSDLSLAAVSDVRAEAAEGIAAEVGVHAYRDYRAMLSEQALDLVVVATPDPLHRDPTLAALKAGVPYIIQEKPLATTLADAEAICEAVERHHAHLFVNYANRAMPMDMATYYVLHQGLLGRVVHGEARLDDNISVPRQLWGMRSRDWAAGSSTAHFLLSHVVDLLRWYFSPAEVHHVYAVSQQQVLGYTPDLYDALLTFDSGLTVRVKAEWIKHIDTIVEFYLAFSGATGTLIYNKLPGYGVEAGWRARFESMLMQDLWTHQQQLLELGINVAACGGDVPEYEEKGRGLTALESIEVGSGGMDLVGHCLDAIVENTLTPHGWQAFGPLPTHVDGLKQTQVVTAIIESAQTGKVVDL